MSAKGTYKSLTKEQLRKLIGDNIVGTAEAADLLDVERSRVGRWKKSGVMPDPVITLSATPIWLRDDIVGMLDEREKRRRGKPDAKKAEPVAA